MRCITGLLVLSVLSASIVAANGKDVKPAAAASAGSTNQLADWEATKSLACRTWSYCVDVAAFGAGYLGVKDLLVDQYNQRAVDLEGLKVQVHELWDLHAAVHYKVVEPHVTMVVDATKSNAQKAWAFADAFVLDLLSAPLDKFEKEFPSQKDVMKRDLFSLLFLDLYLFFVVTHSFMFLKFVWGFVKFVLCGVLCCGMCRRRKSAVAPKKGKNAPPKTAAANGAAKKGK